MAISHDPNQPAEEDDVLITGELAHRSCRTPDYAAENRALAALAQELATNPGGVLQKCAELVTELCRADSAGISLLEPGSESGLFRWHGAAGGLAPHLGRLMEQDVSPYGTAIARDGVLLFREADRLFADLKGAEPRICENLLGWFGSDSRFDAARSARSSTRPRDGSTPKMPACCKASPASRQRPAR